MRILNKKYWPNRVVITSEPKNFSPVMEWLKENSIKYIVFSEYQKTVFNFTNSEDCMLFKLKWGNKWA